MIIISFILGFLIGSYLTVLGANYLRYRGYIKFEWTEKYYK